MSHRPLLYCVPYAGGDTHVYHAWTSALRDVAEVCPVQLPGRGRLLRTPLNSGMAQAVDWLLRQVKPTSDRPVMLFGHSMGALLAYELAQAWRQVGFNGLTRLFVSGYSAPHLPRRRKTRLHTLDDTALLEEINKLEGTPPEILSNREVMEFFLPILRADFKVCETYTHPAHQPLDVPIVAFGGEDDCDHPPESVAQWKSHTSHPFLHRTFAGGHFFLNSERATVLATLREVLTRDVRPVISPSRANALREAIEATHHVYPA